MADPFGLSFIPGQSQQGQGTRPNPIQQAIQTLSLRIPQRAGASAFTPQALLDSPGGGGLGGDPNSAMLLEKIKQWLFGQPGQIGTGPPMPRSPDQTQPSAPWSPGPTLPRDPGPSGTIPGPTPGGYIPAPSYRPPSIPLPNIAPGGGEPRAPEEPPQDAYIPPAPSQPSPFVAREPRVFNRQV